MSDYEETKEEKSVREESIRINPYSQECNNRHLWSEGFRSGFAYAKNFQPQQSWPSEEEIRQAAYQYAGTIIKEVDSDHFNAAVDSVVADFTSGISWIKSRQQKGE